MASPPKGGPPLYTYGSIDDSSEQPTSSRKLTPGASRSGNPNSCPSTVTRGEYLPPQQKNNNLRGPEAAGRRRLSQRLVVALVCGLAFLAGCSVSWIRSATTGRPSGAIGGFFEVGAENGISEIRDNDPSSVLRGNDEAVSALEFTALNFYHVRDGKPGQDYPWLKDVKLIEPHRDTTLAVVGAREGYEYRWEVRAPGGSSGVLGGGGEVQAAATGAVTIVVLTLLDENVVVLEEIDGDGQVTNRLEETVMVKYVRREMRTLTDDEREELLDAMFELWAVRVDGGDGKEIYGEDYADVYAINRLHYKAATNGTCDHFHDGMGFLVSHSLITNTFEFSLQTVNPKLTVPYWDFTIETTSATDLVYDPSLPYTRTELLSPTWFGTVDPEDHMVKDGRWAYTEIPKVIETNPGDLEPDIYGKLRSPWNTNDRQYISRGLGETCQTTADDYITWPNCESHYDLSIGNAEFYEWVWDSMGDPHAPIHFWLGGNIDCDSMYSEIANLIGDDTAKTFAFLANGHRKGLFCDGIWSCEGNAAVDEEPYELAAEGTCGCQDYDLTQGDDYKFVMSQLDFVEFYVGDYSEDVQRKVVEILCSGVVNYGEQSQSSSSLDPMFWPMHPTMERLWQFSVVTGKVNEFTWPDMDMTVVLPDGTSYTQYVSSYYESCNGHHGSHVFPYGLLDSDIDGFEVKTGIKSNPVLGNNLSNREVLAAFDPRSNNLAYIYDTFKWDHCVSEGYDFDDAWGETPTSARKEFFERDGPLSAVYTTFKREMAELMKEKGDILKAKQSQA